MIYNALDTFKQFYLTKGPGAWYQTSAGAVPTVGTLPLTYGGTGANLSATGGTSQVVKQAGAGAAFTVGTLTPTEVLTNFTGTKSSDFVARGDGTMAKAVTADWSVGTGLIFTSNFTAVSGNYEIGRYAGGMRYNVATGTLHSWAIATSDVASLGSAALTVGTSNGITLSGTQTLASSATTGAFRDSGGNFCVSGGSGGGLVVYNNGTIYEGLGQNGIAWYGTQTTIGGTIAHIYRDSAGSLIRNVVNTAFHTGTLSGVQAYKIGASNAAVGYQAGNAIFGSTGVQSTFMGYAAGLNVTTGSYMTGIGGYAFGSGIATGSNYSVAVGYQAGYAVTSGVAGVYIGLAAGAALTTPSNNIAIGQNSMASSATQPGDGNIGIGANAARYLAGSAANNLICGTSAGGSASGLSGSQNVLLGYLAGSALTSGGTNTFIGASAGSTSTTTGGQTAVGYSALGRTGTNSGTNLVAVGANALGANTSGNGSTAVGDSAGYSNTTGTANAFFGYQAGNLNSSGSYNTAIGYSAGSVATTAIANTAVGYSALGGGNASGGYNTAVGYSAGLGTTTASGNVYMGREAGQAVTTGGTSVYIGVQAGLVTTTGTQNVCVGGGAGQGNFTNCVYIGALTGGYALGTASGANNVGVGSYSLNTVSTGFSLTAIGYNSLGAMTTGQSCVGVGYNACASNVSASNNTAVGDSALLTATAGGNTGVGASALYAVTGGTNNSALGVSAGAVGTGSNNVFVGKSTAAALTTGSQCVFVGADSGASVTSGNYNVCIGYGADVASATGSYQVNLAGMLRRDTNGYFAGYVGTSSPTKAFEWQTVTGGTGHVLKQATAGGPITSGTITIADLTQDFIDFFGPVKGVWRQIRSLSTASGTVSMGGPASGKRWIVMGGICKNPNGSSFTFSIYANLNGTNYDMSNGGATNTAGNIYQLTNFSNFPILESTDSLRVNTSASGAHYYFTVFEFDTTYNLKCVYKNSSFTAGFNTVYTAPSTRSAVLVNTSPSQDSINRLGGVSYLNIATGTSQTVYPFMCASGDTVSANHQVYNSLSVSNGWVQGFFPYINTLEASGFCGLNSSTNSASQLMWVNVRELG